MKSRKEASRLSAKARTWTSGAEAQHSTGPTAEEIQMRAYEIYASGGRIDGRDLEDWFQAEKEAAEKVRKQGSS